MGFLEQERKLILIRQQEEQARLEGHGKRVAEELARQRALAEDRSHAPEDNKVICELLDNLPAFDIKAYMETVRRHTGYLGWPFLYTRDEGLSD